MPPPVPPDGGRPRPPPLPPPPTTVLYQLVSVHARPLPGRIVVRSLAGDERIIIPRWDWGQYEIGHLANQLFHATFRRAPGGMNEPVDIQILVGGVVAEADVLVAIYSEAPLLDYEIVSARPPCPGRGRYAWEVVVRDGSDNLRRAYLAPKDMSRYDCMAFARRLNAQRVGFHVVHLTRWPYTMNFAAHAHRYPSTCVNARGIAQPPTMLLRTVLENLFGEEPGAWGSPGSEGLVPEDQRRRRGRRVIEPGPEDDEDDWRRRRWGEEND